MHQVKHGAALPEYWHQSVYSHCGAVVADNLTTELAARPVLGDQSNMDLGRFRRRRTARDMLHNDVEAIKACINCLLHTEAHRRHLETEDFHRRRHDHAGESLGCAATSPSSVTCGHAGRPKSNR